MMTSVNDIPVEVSPNTRAHLSRLAIFHYGSPEKHFSDLLTKFIQIAPWSAWPPLSWRHQTPSTPRNLTDVIIYISMNPDLGEVMKATIDQINTINRHTVDHQPITSKTFLKTAIHWWTTYVYPEPQILHS